MDIQLIYTSTATQSFTEDQLEPLMRRCSVNNREKNITGMLLYGNKHFMQVLEGNNYEVDQLLDRIKRDPRHTDIEVSLRTPIQAREFGKWSMGYRVINQDIKNYPFFVDFFEKKNSNHPDGANNFALQILKLFAFPEQGA